MEYENKYASKGVAGAGLGFGIAGTALGLLNGGALPNVLGGAKTACSEDHYINRYEAAQSARIAELETEVKLRDANTYTDGKILELYKYVDGRFGAVEGELCQQRVYNATNTAAINCINGQIAQLMSLTKIVIPNGSIFPGWGDVTVSITPTTTTPAG
ncbi:MAG: hypothetical protein IJW90_07155 [Clostridia bacterium]|nr:hypothetical protein [Clostridia bacterium]